MERITIEVLDEGREWREVWPTIDMEDPTLEQALEKMKQLKPQYLSVRLTWES